MSTNPRKIVKHSKPFALSKPSAASGNACLHTRRRSAAPAATAQPVSTKMTASTAARLASSSPSAGPVRSSKDRCTQNGLAMLARQTRTKQRSITPNPPAFRSKDASHSKSLLAPQRRGVAASRAKRGRFCGKTTILANASIPHSSRPSATALAISMRALVLVIATPALPVRRANSQTGGHATLLEA